jgi:hypothetical protein
MKSRRSLLFVLPFLIASAWHGSFVSDVCQAADTPEQVSSPVVAHPDVDHSCMDRCEDERLDDIWLVSTRHLGCPSVDKGAKFDLHVEHYGGKEAGWIEKSLDDLFSSSDPMQPTMVYVHGNRVDWCDAIRRGSHARNSILGCSHVPSVRFVIWSWPSNQIHGQIHDVRFKASRTNGEARYLAWFLSQLDSKRPLRLLGYSFGARVITGALHLFAGGDLSGQALATSPRSDMPQRFCVALLAPALHNYWLQPGACHELAMSQMDRLLIQYNSCDPVLQRYRLIEKHARPAALGYTGMYLDDASETLVTQRDVCCYVGDSHAESRYFHSTTVTDEIRELFFQEKVEQ